MKFARLTEAITGKPVLVNLEMVTKVTHNPADKERGYEEYVTLRTLDGGQADVALSFDAATRLLQEGNR